MALFRYQFTLRQFIKLIALVAVCFALLRTPAWPFLLAVGLVLPGFAIDRARGGAGVLGATLAGMIGFLEMGTALYFIDWLLFHDPSNELPPPFTFLVFLGLMGLIWGLFVGIWARLIVACVHQRIRPEPLQGESCGPIYWRDLDVPHEATHR